MDIQSLINNPDMEAIVAAMPLEEKQELAREVQALREATRKENQLLFYKPVSEEAVKFHCSTAPQRVILGGNGSSKSESQIVDIIIEMTGVVPFSLEAVYPKEKLRPPIHSRLIIQSLTSTWENSIKPKLIWDRWTGLGDMVRGHWGWIPRNFLIGGKWENSWSQQYRTLTLTNGSTLQIMSHDQETQDFASSSCHRIGVDEGPRHAVWRENLFRLREGGYISVAMTPPDDESKAWTAAWVYDELYEKGLSGPNKHPDIDSFTFFTEHNSNISQETINKISAGLTPMQREVRLHGAFMHLGGRIYPTYTDRSQFWCFTCQDSVLLVEKKCATCGSDGVVSFKHFVEPFEQAYRWPCVSFLDPHPRKPHCISWFAVSPSDDIFQVAELEVDGEPEVVHNRVTTLEQTLGLNVVRRYIDPNMGASPAGTTNKRGRTVRDEFDAVGLRCDFADDNRETARNRLKNLLKPDSRTKEPRFHVFTTCPRTNYQMLRYVWGEWARNTGDKDPKAIPAETNDDFPALIQYAMNANLTYSGIMSGGGKISKNWKRRGGY